MDGPTSFVGTAEELRSRKWDYELGYRDLVNAVRPAREVSVNFASDYETANALRRVADADVAAGTPGTFVAQGEWKQRGYILEANHDSIHFGRLSTDLTVALLDGAWWRVVQKSFFPDVPRPVPKEYRTQTGETINVLNANDLFHELDGEGYAKQQTTTGKNLLPHDVTSRTVSGVTFTLNEDGSMTANGTATSGGAVLNYLPIGGQNITLQAGTYTLSGCPTGGSSSTYKLDINDENDTYRTDYGSGATFTLRNALMFRRCRIVIYGGVTVNNLVFRPQLEAGSTATSYEPYTGGKPSPSPDYPQEIQVVRGRNLVSEIKTGLFINGTNGVVSISEGAQLAVAKVEKNTDYTLSYTGGNRCIIAGFQNANIALGDTGTVIFSSSSAVSPKTFNSGNYEYVGMFVATSASPASNVQLERGTTPTPYVPYGYIGLDVTHDGTTTTTPIPLPSKGWAGALPDGTADTLTIDSAGHVEWTSACDELSLAVRDMNNSESAPGWSNSGIKAKIGSEFNGLFGMNALANIVGSNSTLKFGANTNGGNDIVYLPSRTYQLDQTQWITSYPDLVVQLYFALTTPTTETADIQLPEFPEGATISIPELDEISVTWEIVPGVNLDYPYDYEYDYSEASTTPDIETSVLTQSAVRFVVFGPATNPAVTIGDNTYQVNVEVPVGGYLTVDGREKTITLTLADGSTQNAFEYGVRGSGLGSGDYIFEPVKPGLQAVSWDGSFGFDFGWYEEEGEPPWSLS